MTVASAPLAPVPWTPPLARVEGQVLASAFEAMLKGLLETDLPLRAVYGPRRAPFEPMFRLLAEEANRRTLDQHQMELVASADASRAVALVERDSTMHRASMALVPNDQLDRAMPALHRLALRRASEDGGAIVVMEDNPYLSPGVCPRRAARQLGVPCLEPCDVPGLRDATEDALRVSRAAGAACALVVHVSILRSLETIEARPNRVMDRVDAVLALRRPRRGPRSGEALDLMRLARRLELNQLLCLPSPGERDAWGFIAVGPCLVAVQHVLRELGLSGRVPLLRLGLCGPIDAAAVMRFLTRCENVAVLEPRPGSVGSEVVAIAERGRSGGERPALLWWDRMPPDPAGETPTFDINEALRPSLLARKIVHLLHAIRPNLQVASRLATGQPQVEAIPVPRRGETLGVSSAMDSARQMLVELADDFSRDQAEDGEPRTSLAVEGEQLRPGERLVIAEVWDRRRFATEGLAAVRQAAQAAVPRLFVLCDLAADDEPEPERLARAAVPPEFAGRFGVERGDLNDRVGFKSLLRQAALKDALTLVIGVDGPPPRRDVAALERAFLEVDRLGFAPTQRLIWAAETACELRPLPTATLVERGLERGTDPLRTEFTVAVQPERWAFLPRIDATPLLEQVEVVRTRPPRIRARDEDRRLPPPRPVHGREGLWRAHVAAYRGDPPGTAAIALCEAGRAMGYRVQSTYHTTPVGPGRRAWAQVLFTRQHAGEQGVIATGVPYGEADLLLGVDPVEALRALGPDPILRVAGPERTFCVVNTGPLRDQIDQASLDAVARLPDALTTACRGDHMLASDVARACRRAFLTDRVADLSLLGAAFQRGLIPVSVEAIESAMRRVEARGYGRSLEAFEFGRRLALAREAEPARELIEPLPRLVRRLVLETARDGRGGRRSAGRLRSLLDAQLARMPELGATETGAAAQRDLVVALHRCVMFGGLQHAQRYAEILSRLYEHDPDLREKEWTALAILPLAEVMLPRDLLYVTTMSTSIEQHRRTREQLEIRSARGDRIERRYLNRVEAIAFGRRFRLDFRSSDWPARMVRAVRGLVPLGARGSITSRMRRDALIGLLDRAASETQYARHWSAVLRTLQGKALDGSIHQLTLEDLESLSRRV